MLFRSTSFLTIVTKDLVGKFHAGKLVGEISGSLGGRGGGKPDLAQGGAPTGDPTTLDAAIARFYTLVENS